MYYDNFSLVIVINIIFTTQALQACTCQWASGSRAWVLQCLELSCSLCTSRICCKLIKKFIYFFKTQRRLLSINYEWGANKFKLEESSQLFWTAELFYWGSLKKLRLKCEFMCKSLGFIAKVFCDWVKLNLWAFIQNRST